MGSADAGDGPERGPDEGPDEERFADLPPVKVTVPDDARELDADVRAYYRELRRRQSGPAPPTPPAPPPPGTMRSTTGPRRLIIGVFALLLFVAAVAMALSPRPGRPERQVPLAAASGADPRGLGEGLLMPDLRVRVGTLEQPLRDLRPAVIALVPPVCRCESELESLLREAIGYQLDVFLVESPQPGTAGPDGRLAPPDPVADGRAELQRLARSLRVSVLDDPTGRIAFGFADPSGALTLILVAPDGTVAEKTLTTSGPDLALKLAEISRSETVEMTVEMEPAEPA